MSRYFTIQEAPDRTWEVLHSDETSTTVVLEGLDRKTATRAMQQLQRTTDYYDDLRTEKC